MNRIVLVCIALFACVATAPAQCRSRSYGSTYSSSYSYPGYSYSAPSYSYAPPYVAPAVKKQTYQDEYQFQKFVLALPLVQLPTYGAVYTPPVQPQQQQSAAPRAASSEMQQILAQQGQTLEAIKALDAAVRRLDDRVSGLERSGRFGAAPPPPPRKDEPEQIPKPPKEEKDQAKAPAPTGNDKLTAALVNKQACAACHERGNEAHGGDFVMSEPDGKFVRLTDKQLLSLERLLISDKMPKINKRSQDHGITGPLSKEAKEALLAERDRQVSLAPEEKKDLKQ